MMKQFKTPKVTLEYEYVRRTRPNIPKDKAGKCWQPEECYLNFPLVISVREARSLWQESQWVVEDILAARETGRFYRVDRKGFGGCSSCFYRELCESENQLGSLDEQTISLLATRREPLKMEAYEANHNH
jgi:hypothetical protein